MIILFKGMITDNLEEGNIALGDLCKPSRSCSCCIRQIRIIKAKNMDTSRGFDYNGRGSSTIFMSSLVALALFLFTRLHDSN